MADTFLAVFNCILTLLTAYLGVHITMHPAETDRSKKVYKAAFCICGLLICCLSALQAHRNHQTSEALTSQMGRIETNTKTPPTVQVNVSPAPPLPCAPKQPVFVQVDQLSQFWLFDVVAGGIQKSESVQFCDKAGWPDIKSCNDAARKAMYFYGGAYPKNDKWKP